MIARYGGEEFVVVLPATDAETAHSICERIVMAFRNTGHVVGSASRQGHDLDRLRDARRPNPLSPTSPSSSRPPIRRSTPPKLRGRNRTVPFDRQLDCAVLAKSG